MSSHSLGSCSVFGPRSSSLPMAAAKNGFDNRGPASSQSDWKQPICSLLRTISILLWSVAIFLFSKLFPTRFLSRSPRPNPTRFFATPWNSIIPCTIPPCPWCCAPRQRRPERKYLKCRWFIKRSRQASTMKSSVCGLNPLGVLLDII